MAIGETKSKLSILSRIPPCPGKMFPLSLTPRERLIIDSHKSPYVENTETITPRLIHVLKSGPLKKGLKKWKNNIDAITHKASPPQKPSQDFFGEILSNNRCLPNNVPTQKAPVSLIHINKNSASSIYGLLVYRILSNDNGKATYSCPIIEKAQASNA